MVTGFASGIASSNEVVAKFEDAIYVLQCFQKKTQKTSLPDVKLAKDRYNDLVRRLRK